MVSGTEREKGGEGGERERERERERENVISLSRDTLHTL